MIFLRPNAKKTALTGILFFFLYTTVLAQDGKQLFAANCQACHSLTKDITGPALAGFTQRGPWGDKKNIYAWIHNPAAFMAKDPYTQGLKARFNIVMSAFPQLSEKDIDAIIAYVNTPPKEEPAGGGAATASQSATDDTAARNAIIFGIISIVLAIVALILMQVNSSLKKLSDDREGIIRPEPVPFYRNKIYIALFSLVMFVVGGYLIGTGAMNLGRQKGYQPDQPIAFSHKVHAGINQINCLYCHGNAWESKHAAIPSMNTCMNCHKAITTYEKGPKLYHPEGEEINGTEEIKKLYKYAGYTPGQAWDPAKAKSIEWVKIHNLPDHVFFSHAQHVNAGNVQCQTCHGNIQEMDVVKQQAELSMGWCVNCHRETKVNFSNKEKGTGNQFYNIYTKFHDDIKSGKMDSVTVENIGGLECQKCHY